MKKNYFMLVCLMLFMAMQATAQVSSIVDLFGKYKFTADVEFTAEGEAYRSQLLGESDVVISEDATYSAKIVGFAGSNEKQNISDINTTTNKLQIINPNNPQLWSTLCLANENGDNPYGVFADGAWAIEMFNEMIYAYNPATKEISVPDFTVVKVTDYKAEKANIIAKYTNVKMTLVQATTVEIADISGDWNFKAGSSTYSTMAGSTIPTEFAVALAKTDDTGRAYNVTIAIEGFDAVTLPATFDGNILSIAYDSTYIDATMGIRFANMNGSTVKKGAIEFKSQSEEAFSLYNGFSFVVDTEKENAEGELVPATELQQWYMDGTLKLPSAAPAFDWAGVYNVKIKSDKDLYIKDAAGIEWPTEFQFEVTYHETSNIYCVTSVFGYDINAINYGGLLFTPAEDGKSVEINTGNLASLGGGNFMKILDMNGTTSPIKMTVNDNGSMSIQGLSVGTGAYQSNENSMNAYYTNLIVVKEGMEIETPEDSEVSAFNWIGQHTVKAGKVDAYDGKEYPAEFTMTVSDVNGAILVTEFMGNDVTGLNNGGISFTIAEDGKSAEMNTGSFVGGKYPDYLKIYDMNASAFPLVFTLNEDGSVNVANFCIKSMNFDTYAEVLVAYYQNVTIPAVGGDVEESEPFDWYGTWEVTVAEQASQNGKDYPTSFYMTIEEAYGYTMITQFMSTDVTGLNYGGIILTVAEDNKSAEMQTGMFAGGKYPEYLKIFDGEGGTNPLAITVNEDGTLSFADFLLATYNWDTKDLAPAVFCMSVTATKCPTGIEDIVVENAVVKGIFDMQGRKIDAITVPGLYIVNGKKVLVK